MARITVLGATGLTGQELVRQALDAGHDVTALVRRPEALPIRHGRLEVVVGDATDADAIARVADGRDGLISSLGRPESGRDKDTIDDSVSVEVCAVSTAHLIELSRAGRGVPRAVFMSTHGAGTSNDGSAYSVKLRDLVGNRVADKDHMEQLLSESTAPLSWTVVRNPYIYAGERGRPHAVYRRIELDDTSSIAYPDLAAFALAELLEPRFEREILTITEPLTGPAAGLPADIAAELGARS